MAYENVSVEIGDDFVAVLTLNRPEQLNTFNTPLATELERAFWELDGDRRVRVIILKGAGKVFCAGIDLNEFFGKTAQQYREWIELMEKPLETIPQMRTPVIAQLHGVAAANGAGMVAAADLAVAADNARMGLTAINVGLNCIGPVVPVSRSVGRKQALEMLLFGDLITADRALEMGLVNRVVPKADLESETRRWAAMLAQKSPVAVQLSKKAFHAAADMEYHQAFAYMNEAFARLCTAEDAAEGINAFKEKRRPVWKEC